MIRYVCKYCGQELGILNNYEIHNFKLGLENLTTSERESIITYEMNGDIVVKIVCEFCEDALNKNPELLLISNPLQ